MSELVVKAEPGDAIISSATDRILLNVNGILRLFREGESKQEAWHEAEPIAPWSSFGPPFDAFGYRKNFGRIEFRGAIRPVESTTVKAIHIFTLPEEFHPSKERIVDSGSHILGISESVAPMPLIIETDGKVYLYQPSEHAEVKMPGDYVGFDGVTFPQ